MIKLFFALASCAIATGTLLLTVFGIPEVPLYVHAQYGRESGHLFVVSRSRQQLDEIDARTKASLGHYDLPGCEEPQGLSIDDRERYAYIACTVNPALITFDLQSHRVIAKHWLDPLRAATAELR